MGAHHAIAFEAWQIVAQWPVTQDEDGTLSITSQNCYPTRLTTKSSSPT